MKVFSTTDSFIRPADTTAYTDGDLVANSTTASSVVPMQFTFTSQGGSIRQVRLTKSDITNVANSTFTLHLFGESPTVSAGDNGAIAYNVSLYLGKVVFPTTVAATDDAYAALRRGESGFVDGIASPYSTIYGLLEAKAAYTPISSEIFTVVMIYE